MVNIIVEIPDRDVHKRLSVGPQHVINCRLNLLLLVVHPPDFPVFMFLSGPEVIRHILWCFQINGHSDLPPPPPSVNLKVKLSSTSRMGFIPS